MGFAEPILAQNLFLPPTAPGTKEPGGAQPGSLEFGIFVFRPTCREKLRALSIVGGLGWFR